MVRDLTSLTAAPARTAATVVAGSGTSRAKQASGNERPAGGGNLPVAETQVDVSRAVEQLNRLARSTARDLHFRVDQTSGRTIITVINAATHEIVRQIPPDEILSLARKLALIDARA